jgi:hypothetical protein
MDFIRIILATGSGKYPPLAFKKNQKKTGYPSRYTARAMQFD